MVQNVIRVKRAELGDVEDFTFKQLSTQLQEDVFACRNIKAVLATLRDQPIIPLYGSKIEYL